MLVGAAESHAEVAGVTWGYGDLAVMKNKATRPAWEKGTAEEGALLGEERARGQQSIRSAEHCSARSLHQEIGDRRRACRSVASRPEPSTIE